MRRAVLAGIRSIEHGTYMTPEIMELMKNRGTFYVPTMLAGKFVGEKALIDGYFPEVVRPKAAAIGPVIHETFTRAYKSGVKIAFGTDSGVSAHGDNAQEFELMVEAGMTPMQAIQSATLVAAELLSEQENLGQIAPGMFADIIAIDGDPLEDIALLQNVSFVMKDGEIYKKQ
jgi:imidazolonepropionase-like amidohydrolase